MKLFLTILFILVSGAFAVAQECGNGEVEEGEACDDGNTIATDACIDCVLAICGDGVVRIGYEQCDDGNQNSLDSCRNNCTLPYCGDSIVDSNEVCDDGGTEDWDGCSGDCSALESDEDVALYNELVSLQNQKLQLLHTQQEFNMSAANQRHNDFDATIARWEVKWDEASAAGRNDTATRIQARIDRLIEQRDFLDSTDLGSPRDEAGKLGPKINELSEAIEELKAQLGIN